MKKWAIRFYILGLIVLSLGHFVYALRTNTFFSIDDFFVIQYFRNHSVLGMIPEFLIHGDMNEFRKIVGFVVFGGLLKTFGVSHLAFDFTMFLTHTMSLILLFFVVKKITANDFASFFVSLIFNKNYLFYYSNIHENLVGLFCILTIFFFLYYPKKFYLSLISFVLAVFSKETAVTLPLGLYAISLFYKMNKEELVFFRKRIYKLLIISVLFGIYAGYLFIERKVLGNNFVYMPTSNIIDILRGYLYFVDYKVIALCILLPIVFKKYNYLGLLVVFFMTLIPAALLVNRREMYYIYMPFLYLMIYISLFLPKINFKSSFLYIVVFLIFGGRSILPKVAWQNFPNWQKVSIDHVLDRLESGSNDFSDIYLERDAKLMIGSGTTDIFLKQRN